MAGKKSGSKPNPSKLNAGSSEAKKNTPSSSETEDLTAAGTNGKPSEDVKKDVFPSSEVKKNAVDGSDSKKNGNSKDKSVKEKSKDKKEKKDGNAVVRWFRDARSEFKKVTWLTPSQLTSTTAKVTIAIIISSLAVFGVNHGIMILLKIIFKMNGSDDGA